MVIDTAPTGHTLLLLDATQSYHKEVERTQGAVTGAVANLLPRLRNPKETEVVIVTLPKRHLYLKLNACKWICNAPELITNGG